MIEPRATESNKIPPLKAFYFREPFEQNFWPDILDEIYRKKVYQRFVLGKKDLTIVDIGANLGLSVYYFSPFAKTVYAIEPSARHLEALRAMIKQNKLSNVIVCPLAISNKNGFSNFYHNPNQTVFSLSELAKNDDFEEVETMTMDAFMERNKLTHIDILKIDPEGEEAKIFQSEGFKKVVPNIKVILGEWHEWCGVSQSNFQYGLEELGYSFKWRRDTIAKVYEAVRT